MRTPPTKPYSGLTIILDEPSRFDKDYNRLLSGPVRDWFDNVVLPAPYSVDSTDIRTLDETAPFDPATKAFIVAGKKGCEKYRLLHDPPGYTGIILGRPALPAFFPQDCLDFKNLRGNDAEIDEATSDRDTKESTPTRAKNWRFWNYWHIRKFLLAGSRELQRLDARCYPRVDEVCKALDAENDLLYLDIETSRVHRSLSCIGVATAQSFPTVYVVPVYLSSGSLAYREFHKFYRSLSLCLSRTEVVIHNSMFDLTVLHGFYKTCLPSRVYDTMVAQHRCFPEAEKSLAHAISCWTGQPYHKDTSTEVYNHEGEKDLWMYNARDVYNLKLIRDAQLEHAKSDEGLMASINQGNASIVPYLTTSLTGLRLDSLKLATVHAKLERHKNLYQKIASILVGKPFNPGSTKQCASFFHDTLHYGVVSKTSAGAPALGSKQLYQLQLKHNNPLIPVVLKYREAAKDASSLECELLTLP